MGQRHRLEAAGVFHASCRGVVWVTAASPKPFLSPVLSRPLCLTSRSVNPHLEKEHGVFLLQRDPWLRPPDTCY